MTQDIESPKQVIDNPIHDSKVFCMAPWIHMHVWPNGRAFPCCLAEHNEGNDISILDSTPNDLYTTNETEDSGITRTNTTIEL